ncbi:transglutaminase family protein [Uliginosibacterium sp. H1]|uniref:transglutaminase family protein n=1 Tax=Uliginosibacterium sp. H1 TaxID=3114757 RepID=UPI002E17A794|nr:transglutaminase family protein [Uliginosibacterium sp. H1]
MLYQIRHETRCRFDSPASYSIHKLRVTPREDAGQRLKRSQIIAPARCSKSHDVWGNTAHLMTLTAPHDEIDVISLSTLETVDAGPQLAAHGGLAPLAFLAETPLTAPDEALREFAMQHLGGGSSNRLGAVREFLSAVTERVPLAAVPCEGARPAFSRGNGAACDQTHVFLAACRTASIPARFVSGYLLSELDHATGHAWADVWLGVDYGWISFDVSNARLADGNLVRLAVGRDRLEACSLRGSHQGGGVEAVEERISVTRVRN